MRLLNYALVLAMAAAPFAAGAEHLKSLDPKSIDPNTPASKDFYQHVNKGWMEDHPLNTPDTVSSTFLMIQATTVSRES